MRENIITAFTLTLFTTFTIASLLPAAYYLLHYIIIYHGSSKVLMSRMVFSVQGQYKPLAPEYKSSNWNAGFQTYVELIFHDLVLWITMYFFIDIIALLALALHAEFLMAFDMTSLAIITIIQFCLLIYRVVKPSTINQNYVSYLTNLRENFEGAMGSNFQSIMLNYLQQSGKCCGVRGYQEWNLTTFKWNNMVEYSGVQYALQVPLSCCRGVAANFTPDCVLSTSTKYIYTDGCLGRVDHLLSYLPAKDIQDLVIVFLVIHAVMVNIYIIYQTRKRKQVKKYMKRNVIKDNTRSMVILER